MKLTKTCYYPWAFMQIHAGGMMQPCSVGPDTDLGDFLIDYFELGHKGIDGQEDFLNNKGLQMLREGMFTGNLRPMCQNCFFWSNELVPVEEFHNQLYEYLKSRLGDSFDPERCDITKTYAYYWMAVSFTNKCNLRCVYCVQSTQADSNPYYKAEIPYEYADEILDMMASKGITKISTCVEGEATLYKYWREAFSKFHKKYPHVHMYMTTNFCREFSDEDMELLASYTLLDISMDSLNPDLYKSLRRNGNLDLIMKNLDKLERKVKEMEVERPTILIHDVVSTATWREIESIADFAFSRGYGLQLGNYEVRTNTLAYKENLMQPIETLPDDELEEMRDMVKRCAEKAEKLGCSITIQGDIFKKADDKVEKNYHRFKCTGGNPIYEAFLEQYPSGTEELHFGIAYDRDNISYAGISMKPKATLTIEGVPQKLRIIYREVYVYKEGHLSPKYHHGVEPGFRKTMDIDDGIFSFTASDRGDEIDHIILDISECILKE